MSGGISSLSLRGTMAGLSAEPKMRPAEMGILVRPAQGEKQKGRLKD